MRRTPGTHRLSAGVRAAIGALGGLALLALRVQANPARVVLLEPAASASALHHCLTRIRQEPVAGGFEVVTVDPGPKTDPLSIANAMDRQTDAVATFAVLGRRRSAAMRTRRQSPVTPEPGEQGALFEQATVGVGGGGTDSTAAGGNRAAGAGGSGASLDAAVTADTGQNRDGAADPPALLDAGAPNSYTNPIISGMHPGLLAVACDRHLARRRGSPTFFRPSPMGASRACTSACTAGPARAPANRPPTGTGSSTPYNEGGASRAPGSAGLRRLPVARLDRNGVEAELYKAQ